MDNSRINVSRWVDGRMAVLEPSNHWRPNATRALARVKARKVRRFRFLWATAAAAASISLCFVLLMAQPACASPYCVGFLKPAAVPQAKTPGAPVPAATGLPVDAQTKPAAAAVPAPVVAEVPKAKVVGQDSLKAVPPRNFKESGSPTARVTVEIYSDYECPMCAVLFRDTVPQLVAQYVQTGKIKLIHRDFPLPQHAYSRLAARYANAAGQTGYYDIVVAQIFKTQDVWNKTGDIDAQVTQVLPPGVMQKVRQLVKSDARLDDTVTADVEMGRQDHLSGTPTVVVVANGKRQNLPSMPSFSLLKAYIEQLLGM
jgi:protein-disulfide isomerase